ncbi:hypothetical protein Vadar_018224 [Vaccinium darrowii]|uniref:Uncharacterized protein n=1 Tax=Vaccinium darrowii TaxID=229202 RepID=A0ACB7X1U9_9ERIC|nr:hypothetical protein Vadar_018224 [Vaccinium darrowii]
MEENQRSTSDIISNLPSNVTENILKGLPLRDAVRTSLRSLCLNNSTFKPPPTFRGFSRIVNLHLRVVTICPVMFGGFISNCPLLERLTLIKCTHFESLKINAPNLKYLKYVGTLGSVSLESTPLLAEIVFFIPSSAANFRQHAEETDSKWVKFFQALPAIEYIHLDSSFFKTFAAGNIPERLPSTLNRLKVLVLSNAYDDNLDYVSILSWAFCLLRSAPNLHRLNSRIFNITTIQDHVTEFLQTQDFSDLLLNQLREVEIEHFSGAEPEMQFVKILLSHSTVLEKMVIWHVREISDQHGFAMVKGLTRFPRASPKAELVVKEGK